MKTTFLYLGLELLLLVGQFQRLGAQSNPDCYDVLYLQNKSEFRGRLTAIKPGDTLVFHTNSGLDIEFPQQRVARIVQHCPKNSRKRMNDQPYTFAERGWYHHTRGAVLIGQNYGSLNTTGYQLQHSSGRMFNRMLGIGLGLGIETFNPRDYDVATYPVFAEIRGYWKPKPVTLFYTLDAGWAFPGRVQGEDIRWGYTDTWKGGWMAQANIGYRFGNHFLIHAGLRLQRKTREWTSTDWLGTINQTGTDRILHKRLVLGIGVLL